MSTPPRATTVPGPQVARRPLLGVGAAAAAATLLSACGSDDGTTPAAGSTSTSSSPTSETDTATGSPTEGGGGAALVKLSAVPVGGAVEVKAGDKPVIIAQPMAGEVVGFDAACTHKGCPVKPAGATLDCPCHGSSFDALTGKNLGGPAQSPLAPFAVKVQGEDVVAG